MTHSSVMRWAAALSVVAATTLSIMYVRPWKPRWQRELDKASLWNFTPGRHEEAQRLKMRIQNEIFRLPNWNVEIARELESIAQRSEGLVYRFTETGDDVAQEEGDALRAFQWVMLFCTERIRIGAPIDPDARAIINDLYFAAADHPEPMIRLSIGTDICYAGMVEDPRFRSLAEELQNDPDPDVAGNARRQLQAYKIYGSRKVEE